MALHALVFHQDPFSYAHKNFNMPSSCNLGFEEGEEEEEEEEEASYRGQTFSQNTHQLNDHMLQSVINRRDQMSSFPENCCDDRDQVAPPAMTTVCSRRKRQKTKPVKNKEEVENQRINHIEVERNRRKLMNGYLAMLRSLMPPSYVQRGDQASIIGGAVNFVKELEQHLHSLKAQKQDVNDIKQSEPDFPYSSSPFSDFFTFPQYCMNPARYNHLGFPESSVAVENYSAIANVEVTMVDGHAHIKVLSRKYAKQLLKMVVGIQSLGFNVQHLNVTTADHMALYSFSVRVRESNNALAMILLLAQREILSLPLTGKKIYCVLVMHIHK